jgi:hypothetical protein
MHHGENLENNFQQNFVIDDGLCPSSIMLLILMHIWMI